MKFLRNAWMIVHMWLCVGAVMLGYDRSVPWWELLILVSVAYFASDIALLLARLSLGRQRLQKLTRMFQAPPAPGY
jgi:hypothetical protein